MLEAEFGGRNRLRRYSVEDSQLGEFADSVGKDIETQPKWTKIRGGLQQAHLTEACSFKAECCCKTADTGTCDYNIHNSITPSPVHYASGGRDSRSVG